MNCIKKIFSPLGGRKEAVKQRDLTDCAAACLASVAAHYRLQLPVSRIRQYAGTDKSGTNVLGLLEAAKKLGFEAKGAKGQLDSLYKIPLPAIAHVVVKNQLQHFVVIYEISKKRVTIMDPADGAIHKKAISEFQQQWSGVIVLLLPDTSFVKGNEKVSNTARFWQLIRPHKGMMLQALIGAVVYTVLGLAMSVYVQKIVDFVLVEGNTKLLNLMSIAMLAIIVFQTIIGYVKSLIGLQTGQFIDARLILGYYKHLLKLPQRFFDTMRVGEIISRVNDAVKIRMFVNDVSLNMVVNVLIVCFSFTIMFIYYWKLALMMLAILPLYALLYCIGRSLYKKWQRTLMENSADLEAQLVESMNAAGTVKRFGLEEYANEKTENRFIILLRSIYQVGSKGLYLGNASSLVTQVFTVGILWAGSFFVIQRDLSPGELLSFYALIGYFTSPALSLISANKDMQDALIAADRLFEIIDLETEADKEEKIRLTPQLLGDIRFNKVCFRYGTRDTVFEGLTLTIEQHTSTAIVGESGSGKSTLMSLLQNLYPLKDGSITIGGTDIRYVANNSLRKIIGVVPQQIDLFSGTFIENIAVGEPAPDMQRILDLCTRLGIHEFIEQLPNTYYSVINEQGSNLSGGQKQRLAIARALYRNPEILILDEATASLDPASEQKVQQTLQWFRQQNKTVIIIAHRFSTVKNCDKIMVLQSGRMVEEGTHETLMQNKHGLYAQMWNDYAVHG